MRTKEMAIVLNECRAEQALIPFRGNPMRSYGSTSSQIIFDTNPEYNMFFLHLADTIHKKYNVNRFISLGRFFYELHIFYHHNIIWRHDEV